MQYIPELAGIADDAFELRVKIVLSLDQYLSDGLISWPGNDEMIDQDESYILWDFKAVEKENDETRDLQ